MTAGTRQDPWVLKTPPGTSQYTMYADDQADPPVLVCQVGSTTLKYRLRAIDDLHAWLAEQSDWVPLGAADELVGWGPDDERLGIRPSVVISADHEMGHIDLTHGLRLAV